MALSASQARVFSLCLWALRIATSESTTGSCSVFDSTGACEAMQLPASAEAEMEQQELGEATALQMEMLQVKTNAAKISQHKVVAPAVEAQEANSSAGVELVTTDHNGNICMLCGKPLPERVDKEYKEFRTDCGSMSSPSGPTHETLASPVAQLLERGTGASKGEKNGFCKLNFAKSCADAVANRDYLYWAKSLDLNSTSLRSNAEWDGRYCAMNGFLDKEIVSLQHDFEAMSAKGRDLCEKKYSKYTDKITFLDMMAASRYDDPTAPKQDEAEKLAAWNCAMGDLGCDLALCAYSFCKTSHGTGLYDECEGWHPVRGMPIF